MVFAAGLSEQHAGFTEKARVIQLLQQYGLPVHMDFDKAHVLRVMQADKEKSKRSYPLYFAAVHWQSFDTAADHRSHTATNRTINMNISIQPSAISGTITAPASKSAMQRACAAALLKGGATIIRNYGRSDDDKAALQVIADLGATVVYTDTDELKITSVPLESLKAAEGRIHCGESGLSVRMFTPVAALLDQEISISGSGSLQERPMDFWHEVLPQLDVALTSNNGLLPLTVKGPLQPRDISMDGRLSSQFLTGLLFAYCAAGASDKSIRVEELNSRPYVDLTLKVLEDFGFDLPENRNYETFYFRSALTPAIRRRQETLLIPWNRIGVVQPSCWLPGLLQEA